MDRGRLVEKIGGRRNMQVTWKKYSGTKKHCSKLARWRELEQ